MSTYPLRLYRAPGPDSVVVNSGDEEDAAHASGYTEEPPAKQEFPKALYLHPVDKTQEHKSIVVQTPEEMDKSISDGYKVEPHVPETPVDEQFEGSVPDQSAGEEIAPEGNAGDSQV